MIVVATLKVKSGSEAAFEQAAREMIDYVKQSEPGTLKYVLHRSTSDPTEFLFYEVYRDQAAMTAHSSSEAMGKLFATLGTLLDGRPTIAMYEEIAGKK
jgi:quinol monooxygenase YgiN